MSTLPYILFELVLAAINLPFALKGKPLNIFAMLLCLVFAAIMTVRLIRS